MTQNPSDPVVPDGDTDPGSAPSGDTAPDPTADATVDEASEESFPASDPPSTWSGEPSSTTGGGS